MSRDHRKKRIGSSAAGRPMHLGIIIGLLLGLGIALAVALYINKDPNPFVDKYEHAAAATKTDGAKSGTEEVQLEFDFYKILPGWEEAISDREFRRQSAAVDEQVYFLQVAAFPDPADADNLKARLALSGIESKIQTAELADGKIWHRVRLGPFSEESELNASREALRQLKLEANLIKVPQPG
ncbi:MAG: SPOR domain-containing protein [Betaproteobacteria bacterium]|jgi:cell division protein FtsN|nr:MAG: SPOR domain-containing protein [Betaproteobacteria bacterium]